MRNLHLLVYFFLYLLIGTVAVVSVQGQEPAANNDQSREANVDILPATAPDGQPRQISDWALAGVVWSDACLVRKLASESAKLAIDDNEAAQMTAVARQADDLIVALEQFGWKRLRKGSLNSKKRIVPNGPPATRLIPAPGDVDVIVDTPELIEDRPNFRLQGLGGAGEGLPEPVEAGIEEAIARRALRPAEFDQERGQISYRESQTNSGTMPYSYDSIYDVDDVNPDVDFQLERPLIVATPNEQIEPLGRPSDARADERSPTGQLKRDVADAYGTDDGNIEPIEDMELNPSGKPSELLDRLAGVSDLSQYSKQQGRHAGDADWVQLHLKQNEMFWQQVAQSGALAEATSMANIQLGNSARIALQATENSRLEAILTPILR